MSSMVRRSGHRALAPWVSPRSPKAFLTMVFQDPALITQRRRIPFLHSRFARTLKSMKVVKDLILLRSALSNTTHKGRRRDNPELKCVKPCARRTKLS